MERKEIIVVVLIGVLLLTMGLQTIQLTGLSQAQVIVPSTTGATVAPIKAVSTGSSHSVPTNLQNLPSMVGGC